MKIDQRLEAVQVDELAGWAGKLVVALVQLGGNVPSAPDALEQAYSRLTVETDILVPTLAHSAWGSIEALIAVVILRETKDDLLKLSRWDGSSSVVWAALAQRLLSCDGLCLTPAAARLNQSMEIAAVHPRRCLAEVRLRGSC